MSKFSDPQSALEFIKKLLVKAGDKGISEYELISKHDPLMVTRILSLMVERNQLALRFDEREVGPKRRIYSLINT